MGMSDKNLKAVISCLQELAADGTMEQGQQEVIIRAIFDLRRSLRSRDPKKVHAAVGRVAQIFLRAQGR